MEEKKPTSLFFSSSFLRLTGEMEEIYSRGFIGKCGEDAREGRVVEGREWVLRRERAARAARKNEAGG